MKVVPFSACPKLAFGACRNEEYTFVECFIGNFDGCDSLAISCSKCACSKLVL
ncbi:hypothetical protein ACUH7Y_16765 [Clostridium beijerinckii]|uniref:Uncharacterized protein n=1 Tax=Clostridium beijerinckii TaxID=1520 RepID=A0A7X9SRR0_CLOBE|nr:hypothetical protein [Clostridium beijerinckii]NMF06833.1 hypothetical protein [Clostridium beijerinckii]